MTLQGYREIVGDRRFFDLARTVQRMYAHGAISTQEFSAEARRASGPSGADRALLDQYFQQWLYGTSKPTLLPEAF